MSTDQHHMLRMLLLQSLINVPIRTVCYNQNGQRVTNLKDLKMRLQCCFIVILICLQQQVPKLNQTGLRSAAMATINA